MTIKRSTKPHKQLRRPLTKLEKAVLLAADEPTTVSSLVAKVRAQRDVYFLPERVLEVVTDLKTKGLLEVVA